MQGGGDYQELCPVRASSGGRIEATKVGADDLIRAPKLVVGEVQPVQPEHIRTGTELRHQAAWCRMEVGSDVQPFGGVIRRADTLEAGNSNVESIYTCWVLEASEGPCTESRPRSKELPSPSVKPTSLQFSHDMVFSRGSIYDVHGLSSRLRSLDGDRILTSRGVLVAVPWHEISHDARLYRVGHL